MKRWIRPFDETWPGMARGEPLGGSFAPFEALRTHIRHSPETQVMLVACSDPAAVLSVMGHDDLSLISAVDMVSVMRSWQDRFGAVPVMVGEGWVTVSVARPPTSEHQSLLLAAEHYAVSPPESGGVEGALSALADGLRGELSPSWHWFDVDPRIWMFGPEDC